MSKNLCLQAKKCQHLRVRQLNLISDYEKGAYFQNVSLFLRIGLFLSKNRKKEDIFVQSQHVIWYVTAGTLG